jgi:hypothetical protein
MQVRFFNGQQMGDDQRWLSVVDHPAQIVRTGRKHGPGLIILGAHMQNTLNRIGVILLLLIL